MFLAVGFYAWKAVSPALQLRALSHLLRPRSPVYRGEPAQGGIEHFQVHDSVKSGKALKVTP